MGRFAGLALATAGAAGAAGAADAGAADAESQRSAAAGALPRGALLLSCNSKSAGSLPSSPARCPARCPASRRAANKPRGLFCPLSSVFMKSPTSTVKHEMCLVDAFPEAQAVDLLASPRGDRSGRRSEASGASPGGRAEARQSETMPDKARQGETRRDNAIQSQRMPENARQCQRMPDNAIECKRMR